MKISLSCAAACLLSVAGAEKATTVSQTVDVFEFTGDFGGGFGPPVDAGNAIATATRTQAGIGLYAKTTGLPAGTYTIWWFIVNDPSVCMKNDTAYPHQCDWADVTNAENSAVIGATGDVVDGTGEFTATSWLPVNNMVGSDGAQLLPGGVRGELSDPWGSEIHIDLLYHGLPLPLGNGSSIDDLFGQLRYTKGGCQYYAENGGMEPAPRDDGACPAFHSAIFPATEDPNVEEDEDVTVSKQYDDMSGAAGGVVGSLFASVGAMVAAAFVAF